MVSSPSSKVAPLRTPTPVVAAQVVIPPPYSADGVRQWVPAFMLSDPQQQDASKSKTNADGSGADLLLATTPDGCERLADGCCFRTTCCASCDDATILEQQRKQGTFKRVDAPTALAARIKVYSTLGLWSTAVAFIFIMSVLFATEFSDVAAIVTFSMGLLPVLLPIIPCAVAVHQFSKGRWTRRAPGSCCSIGQTTYPSIAGALHNWMVVCAIFATLGVTTTLGVIAAKAGNGMAQYGVGYAYGWCGTGLIDDNYWYGAGWYSNGDYAASGSLGSGLQGSGVMPGLGVVEYDSVEGVWLLEPSHAGEAAEDAAVAGSGAETAAAWLSAKPTMPPVFRPKPEPAFGLGYGYQSDYDAAEPMYVGGGYAYPSYDDDDDYSAGNGPTTLVLYVVLFMVQFVAMVAQIMLAVSLQRFKVSVLELGNGSTLRRANLSINEAQLLWQQQVSGCNTDGSFDV